MKVLELDTRLVRRECMPAIAQGLDGNASLEKLCLGLHGGSLHGPAWQAMIQQNCSLEEIKLQFASTASDGFESFARGIPQNTSLKTLDLSWSRIGNAATAILVDAIQSNDTV
jgi:hypothetical protein